MVLNPQASSCPTSSRGGSAIKLLLLLLVPAVWVPNFSLHDATGTGSECQCFYNSLSLIT